MTTFAFRILVLSLALPLLFASPARAVSIGITDTFQDGTVMNWIVAAGPVGGPHPAPPQNVDNGQGGAADRFLLLTAIGGGGPGGRLTVLNGSQWAGNYLAAGIDAISMDVLNLGTTDLFLRLMFEDPIPGPPANIAFSSNAILLPSGSGWTHIVFTLDPASLTAGLGTVNLALSNTTFIRLYHSEIATFPGAAVPVPPVVTQLGVDNIMAVDAGVSSTVPEPASLTLLVAGLSALMARQRRRR